MFSEEPVIQSVQKKSLELLKDIDQIFSQYGIQYMLSAGTALGAVRHDGFIPWDDDVDFDMHIDDMKKLSKMAKKDAIFREKFFLQNKWTELNVTEQFWRIRMNGTTMMDKEGLTIPMHWGLPIDIFPVYNAPKAKILRKLMLLLDRRSLRYSRMPFLNPDAPMKKKKAATRKFRMYSNALYLISCCARRSGLLFYPTGHGTDENRFIPKTVFFPTEKIDFEGCSFSCHHDVHEYLRITYGNYMELPPEEERKNHGCFKIDMEKDYSEYVNYKTN